MNDNQYDNARAVSEELRVGIKQLQWVLQHAINIYNLIKPPEKPPIEDYDPAQIAMTFDEPKNEN